MRKSCTTLLLSAPALAAQAVPGAQTGSHADEKPANVVVIFIDDVGPDLLRVYDEVNQYHGVSNPFTDGIYVQSPTIDSVAAQGVTFLNAYATPVCSAARASLLTGMRTTSHGVGKVIREDLIGELTEFGDPGFEHRTLAQMVKGQGFHAGIIGKWHLSLDQNEPSPNGSLGWDGIQARGHWDEMHCTFSNLDIEPMPDGGGYYNYYQYINTNGLGRRTQLTNYATSQQFSDATAYCNSAPEPFLAYIAPNACHSPFEELPPPELVNTPQYMQGAPSYHKNFAAMLEALDTELGRFLDDLDPVRKSNTLFILMGDNGTDDALFKSMLLQSQLDLGETYKELVADNQLRWKHSVYEGGIRVPLIVWGKGVSEPGRTNDALVDVTDLFPTIAEVTGADAGNVDGFSFYPAIEEPGIGLDSHARQSVVVDFFFENGTPDNATDMRQASCLFNIPGDGQFKVVRKFGLPGWSAGKAYLPPVGLVVDEFYQLTDGQGNVVDPRELEPLATEVGAPFRSQYLRVVAVLDEALIGLPVSSFCSSFPNSAGRVATMDHAGTSSVQANDLVLLARDLPPNAPSFFFYSWYESNVPFVNGLLCVESLDVGLFRFNLAYADASGVLTQPVDHRLSANGPGELSIGSTWKFQAWYRDVAAGGAMSNTTDGLSVHFIP